MTPLCIWLLAAGASETHLEPLDAYLRHIPGMEDLPELSVIYGSCAMDSDCFRLRGQLFENEKRHKPMNVVLAKEPRITWGNRRGENRVKCGMVLFVDLDAGGRSKSGNSAPGRFGPFVHSLWTHCKGGSLNASTCRAVKPYLAPGCTDTPGNRYAFLLFRHACSADLKLPARFKYGKDRLSLLALLADNPGLTPVSATFLEAGAPES